MKEIFLFLLTFFFFPLEKNLPFYFYFSFLFIFFLKKNRGLIFFFLMALVCKNSLIKEIPLKDFENFKGRVLSFPYEGDYGISILVKWQNYGVAPVYIQNYDGKIPDPGTDIEVRAERILREKSPKPFSNQYEFYLKIKDLSQIERKKEGIISKIIYFPSKLNSYFYEKVKTYLSEFKNLKPFAKALIFARFGQEDENFFEAFQMAGIVHILSISGLHIGIFAFYFLIFLRFFKMPPQYIYILTIIFLFSYSSFCGFRAPVLRASLMLSIYFFALLIHRPITYEKSLYLSFPLNGFLMPHQILTPGFFLSYLSTYILIKTAPFFENWFKTLLISSFYVQIFIQPFLLYSFGILNWQAILLNPLLIPFVFLFLLFSPIILILPFPFILKIFDQICFFIFQIIQSTKNYLWWGSFLPFLPLSLLIFYYFFTIFYIEKKGRKRNILYFLFIFLILTLLFHFFTLKKGEREILFLNVGQGSSTLIKDEFFNILIDTGKRDYFNWLIPSLLKEKVEYLNFLILSHPDEDHDRWAEKIIDTIPVGAIGFPEIFSKEYESLKGRAERKNIKVIPLLEGKSFYTKNLNFEVLSPQKRIYVSENEGSLVLQINSKKKSILIMSDATYETEKEILKKLDKKPFFLSSGHHGGKSSTSEIFLKCIKPRVAIISVGKRNIYSHPSKEVIERLKRKRILILRTDQRGDIRINF